jgi:hypothetical protein
MKIWYYQFVAGASEKCPYSYYVTALSWTADPQSMF